MLLKKVFYILRRHLTKRNPMYSNLESYLKNLLGENYSRFEQAGEKAPAIRVNTLKTDIKSIKQEITASGVKFATHGICPEGFIIANENLPLSQTLLYFLGKIFYQGFSSQLPVVALNPLPGEKVLDIAAAPGSKSTQIAARMKNNGILILNDASSNRQQGLLANLYRAGVYNDIVLNVPGQRIGKFLPEYFDKVLVDAPCSGLGKMPSSKYFLDRPYPDSLYGLLNTQRHLLISAIKATKPGGTIVYSTCSITPEENEHIIEMAIKNYPVKLVEIKGWQHPNLMQPFASSLDISKNCKRTFPYPKPVEAFFIAKLIKTDSLNSNHVSTPFPQNKTLGPHSPKISSILDWLSSRWEIPRIFFDSYRFIQTSKKLWLLSKDIKTVPQMGFIKSGIPFAEHRGREWKLTNTSVQLFGNHIFANPIELDDKTLVQLFEKGKIPYPSKLNDYFILHRKELKLGIVSIIDNSLKIHLPHLFKLVL